MSDTVANPNWSNSFWDCFNPIDVCLLSWLCPCIQYGKTQARRQDPTLANYSPVNENCLIFCGLNCFGAYWLIQTKTRTELREEYGITQTHLEKFLKMEPGSIKSKHNIAESLVQDCISNFWCPCCALVQEEKEVILRGSNPKQGYQKTDGMSYP
ncbi:hypothetical protein FQN54_002797 [Arachnomyces sp. PD_36]|nr:hypothetical protein FQN54_002797 [Arachnomyces sp. PD_36]